MSRARFVLAVLNGALLIAAACGGPQKLGDSGSTCFRDDDCAAGFICLAPTPMDIHRVCSNDPTPLISTVEGPPVMALGGGAGMAGMAAAAGNAAAAGSANGGSATAGTDTGGTGGTASGGTGGKTTGGTGGNANGGMAGIATGGTASGTGGGGTAGTGGTAPEAGAPP